MGSLGSTGREHGAGSRYARNFQKISARKSFYKGWNLLVHILHHFLRIFTPSFAE
jgi:hypothetical protein